MVIEDKIVYVGPFQGKEDRPAGRELFSNVFVKNLPAEDTDEDLLKLVSEFGEATSAIIMKVSEGEKGMLMLTPQGIWLHIAGMAAL